MNRNTIIFGVAGAALALFAGAAVLYMNRSDAPPAMVDITGEPAPVVLAPAPATAPLAAAETPVAPSPAPDAPNAPDAPAPSTPASAPKATAPAAPAASAVQWNQYVRQHSPVLGRTDARVTIVEFLDPACEACRAFYPVVHEIMRRHPNDVRVVVRYTPLHNGSEEAVRILETARMQNLFEPVLTAVFAQQPQWADHGSPQIGRAWDAAATAGLDVDKARAAMQAQHITAALKQDAADAAALKVQGTPTFFVNEKPLKEFGPQQLYDLVLSEIAATN